MGLVKTHSQNELGDIISGPCCIGEWYLASRFFNPRLFTLHVWVQEVAQPKR